MNRSLSVCVALSTALLLWSGCALRSSQDATVAVDEREFSAWDCVRIQGELDRVQRAATRVAFAFDERAGNNIIAMSLGVSVFWPALLAMRSTEPEARELSVLRGRFDALSKVSSAKGCDGALTEAELAELSVRVGDVLTYEQRSSASTAPRSWATHVAAVTRQGLVLANASSGEIAEGTWAFDRSGNLLKAPVSPVWPQLVRDELILGQVISGTMIDSSDPLSWARLRGQVVAVGPQAIGERRLDAAVIDLFGDAQRNDSSSRLEGVLVIDRSTGLLIRLDLESAHPAFQLQRRLVRIRSGQ
jgi:hypothetical protein